MDKFSNQLDSQWGNFDSHNGLQGFQDLMPFRIRDILLVSSPYDLYLFEEDGRLYELIREEYQGLNLSHAPELTRVSSGWKALELAKEEKRFDLIITTPHIEDMSVARFAKMIRNSDVNIPIVLLTFDNRETTESLAKYNSDFFDRVFIWQGDFRIIIGIIKHLEDSLNVEQDVVAGVQVIILVEDSVRFYSSYLPIIYTEIFKQSMRVISEGVNLSDRFLKMRARPKILMCTNYEDAWYNFKRYKDSILGIISDINFMRDGKQDPQAGIEFAKNVKKLYNDIPILLQSNSPEKKQESHDVGASFLLKDSPTLLSGLRKVMREQFGFGDFIFRTENGDAVGRASDLLSLEKEISNIPDDSIKYHAERNHFSNWLKARGEFVLGQDLRSTNVADFPSVNEVKKMLVNSLKEYRKSRKRGSITDFNKDSFDPQNSLARIGGGSLGGKARGLSFVNLQLYNFRLHNHFPGIKLGVPSGVILGTDVFDYFMDKNNLWEFALSENDDQKITRRFIKANIFSQDAINHLFQFLDLVRVPLAVRSSSLLEDSQFHPFAGVYETYMLPNLNFDTNTRLWQLLNAIKCVYASTFYNRTKDYITVTSYRLEEEKMAVIIQKMVGAAHGHRFYPEFSGVAKSHNFYPIPPQTAGDGLISVSLGLGKTVVEGGRTVKFAPKYPLHIPQFSSINDTLKNSQQEFFALNLKTAAKKSNNNSSLLESYSLSVAEKDGTLYNVASTYSKENHAIYDGLSRAGTRVVTFAPILKNKIFPLPQILEMLLGLGRKGMGTSVEIEFAVNMSVPQGEPMELAVLQMRPLVINREVEQLNVDNIAKKKILCKSSQVLGNGVIENIFDIVVVNYEHYDRSKSREAAREVHTLNSRLLKEQRPYLLIGMGRWGSKDPWLGIPVKWEQICGARAIIETSFKDFEVTPSQGSHFFQNLTSFLVGYFTVNPSLENSFVDWDWLLNKKAHYALEYTRHLRLKEPVVVKMNGHKQKGIIIKPAR